MRVFRQKFTLEDAIGSHACSLEASRRVTNDIPLGCPLFLPVHTVKCVQTLKDFTGDLDCARCSVLQRSCSREECDKDVQAIASYFRTRSVALGGMSWRWITIPTQRRPGWDTSCAYCMPSRESAFLPDDFTTLQLPCVGLTMNSATNLMTSQHCRCLVVGLTMKSATKPDGAFSGVRLLTRRH